MDIINMMFLLFLKFIQHLQDLRLVGTGSGLAIVPVNHLDKDVSIIANLHRYKATVHTTGRWKFSALSLNFFRASFSVVAPFTIDEILGLPTYSRIVWSWSAVGGSSVMFRSNSARELSDCAV